MNTQHSHTNPSAKNQFTIDAKFINSQKLELLKSNRETYIAQMLGMKRKQIEKNYQLIQLQLKIAFDTQNQRAYEILLEMESQVLEALVLNI